jgi:hypothetical protein
VCTAKALPEPGYRLVNYIHIQRLRITDIPNVESCDCFITDSVSEVYVY